MLKKISWLLLALLCLASNVQAGEVFSCRVSIDSYSFIEYVAVTGTDVVGWEGWTDRDKVLQIPANADWYYIHVNANAVDCEDVVPVAVAAVTECLGFYAPVTEFVVDGVTYSAGTDGWISFLVPADAVWTWVVTVDGWTANFSQTETEGCHYVD